jgi:hypothetical protein
MTPGSGASEFPAIALTSTVDGDVSITVRFKPIVLPDGSGEELSRQITERIPPPPFGRDSGGISCVWSGGEEAPI